MARMPSPSSQLNSNASFSSNVVPTNNYEKSSKYSDINSTDISNSSDSFKNSVTTNFFNENECCCLH